MKDLNKLRSEFENLSEIAEILNEEKSHFNGDFYNLPFNSCAESFINGAWYAWQEKVKAQAVPEGYVLMPLEPTQEMLGAANLAPMPMVHIDSISGREKLRISTQYKAMVNVCKSGAEG